MDENVAVDAEEVDALETDDALALVQSINLDGLRLSAGKAGDYVAHLIAEEEHAAPFHATQEHLNLLFVNRRCWLICAVAVVI